jgi:hypothetical protein
MTTEQQSTIVELQQRYCDNFTALQGDMSGRIATQRYLDASTAIYHNEVIGLGFIPKIYNMPALRFLDSVATTTYQILEKVTDRFLIDPEYRKLFCFSPTLERLICLPTGYKTTIPIMRMDIFLDEENFEFKFCEFNTDGASAMNEDREGADALSVSTAFECTAPELALQPQELFDGWVDEFLAIYESSEQAVEQPTVAMVDYGASATMHEFEEFRARFEARGYRCLICDISSLFYRDGALYGTDVDPKGTGYVGPETLNAVYRRAVTGEIIRELEGEDDNLHMGAQALIKAVEEKSICMIGGFVTHIAHVKQLSTVLHLAETEAFLSEDETEFIRKHIPYTTRLDSEHIDLAGVKAQKNRWIIKPEDGYASQGVYAGVDYSGEDWAGLVDACSVKPYVVQSYCKQYATPNTRPVPRTEVGEALFSSMDEYSKLQERFESTRLEPWNILTGLYLYNGRLSGIYIRAGQKGIIVGYAGGICVPTFLAGYDEQAGLALRTRPLTAGAAQA